MTRSTSGFRGRASVRAMATLLASVGLAAVLPAAATAQTRPAEHCVYSTTASTYTCHQTLAAAQQRGNRLARANGEVIGATVFEDRDYGGASLTITVPEPCPKNDKVDFWLDLDGFWRNRISSVQAWSTCWVWLYPDSGDRAGPYKDKHPQVGAYINDRTTTVGLS